MKRLLSLPPNLVDCFHEITHADPAQWFCTSDPIGHKLGSGGGTAWLLEACRHSEENASDEKRLAGETPRTDEEKALMDWLPREKRILLHAGGQSRRLPGYAPSGKILTPIPVFRWARGQRLSQDLLSLQLPLYDRILQRAPESLHTLIASGDVYIRASQSLQPIPEADVVCYGLWVDPALARNHGVYLSSRRRPDRLDFMLQKPSVEELGLLMQTHYFLMDIGIWLLSDRAVELLVRRSHDAQGNLRFYDMYSEFGLALGEHPRIDDPELNALSVAILPLPGGEFYHYGTSRELISSTLAVQNLVNDQREIIHRKVKPHPAMFVQNAEVALPLTADNHEVWIENSCVGPHWQLHARHLITGVPANDWPLRVPEGVCVDVVPVGEGQYAARPYGFLDAFKGAMDNPLTLYQGQPVTEWCAARGIQPSIVEGRDDLQSARLFPLVDDVENLGLVLRWMVSEPQLEAGRNLWLRATKLSADELSARANLRRLTAQREVYRTSNWSALAANHERSVFYQLNLEEAAQAYAAHHLPLPAPLAETAPLMRRISDSMFRSRVLQLQGQPCEEQERKAFALMCDGLTATAFSAPQQPKLSVHKDQIVWGRSPVRIDLAGGWTDTPPFCLHEGGNVVNIAIELNGQPPLQVYVKPASQPAVILRSIDLGASETIHTYEELRRFNQVGSPFSIPKAALALCGFLPEFAAHPYRSLQAQLQDFGAGLEITLLSAIPAGSGLGTSSILSSTVLGALSDFCGLGWDAHQIAHRTLILEQLLTTGGGWQDQYGGVLRGVKLLQTTAGLAQQPLVRWLPDDLFTSEEYRPCHLLYYTGITRTAKGILGEIVRGMFLNDTARLSILHEMKGHALDLYDAIQRGRFAEMGRLVGHSWTLNQALDAGTNPPAVAAIVDKVKDLCLGLKLPGAGGGGYLYMVAKDPDAAARIRTQLTACPPNDCARFVEMTMSRKGLQVSRS
jgi:galactokinase/mevalonate kinase-like predicted kinase